MSSFQINAFNVSMVCYVKCMTMVCYEYHAVSIGLFYDFDKKTFSNKITKSACFLSSYLDREDT